MGPCVRYIPSFDRVEKWILTLSWIEFASGIGYRRECF